MRVNTVLQKLQCDNRLTMVTSEDVPLTREEMFPVHFALMDYSRLVHGKFDGIYNERCLHGYSYQHGEGSQTGRRSLFEAYSRLLVIRLCWIVTLALQRS